MLSNKYLQLVLFNICIFALGLEVNLSAKDTKTWSGSNIMQTATSIQKITNDIFFALRLQKSKSNERLKQYAVTYNYFSSITSKDDENLHQISIASRVDSIVGNVSHDLVDVINDILNEEPGNNTQDSKDDLQIYVNDFLKNLEYLKNSNGVNNINYDIDNQILQLIRSDEHNVTKKDPDVDDDYDDSSDNEFWRPGDTTRRIYKGENTKVRYFPFMASIHIFKNFQCGGSIIKSDLVITAASCLQLAYNNRFFRENPAFLSVRIGSNYYVGGGETIAVLEVYFYPTYDPKTLNNNIAIMRLDRRIKFKHHGTSRVKKIEFDTNAHNLPMSGIENGITIVGWGAKGVSNVVRDPWNNRLSFAVLDVYPLRECQEIYSQKYVTQKTFCAGFFSKGAGACSGDVGGPGIVAGVLAGIVSFGSPRCGTPDAPTVFTKVGYYADWIEEIMEQDVPVHSRITTTRSPPTFYTPPPDKISTKYVMLPIFEKDFLPAAINQARSGPKRHHPLRSGKKNTKKRQPEKDDQDIEEENLFKEFLAVMFGSNEVNDYERLLDKGKEAKRVNVKKIRKKKKITTTPADESDENSDDKEQKKATRSYQTTAIIEESKHDSNEVPLFDDHDMVGANNPDDGDKVDGDDNLEVDGDVLEDNILKLIEGLDITSENEIDKLVAQISNEPHSQETDEVDSKKLRKKNKLKSSRKDKDAVDNVDMQYENVDNDEIFEINDPDTFDEPHDLETVEIDNEKLRKKNKLKSSRKEKDTVDNVDIQNESLDNDEIFEINDHDTLDDGVSVTTEFEDLTLREKKNINNKKDKVDVADSIFDLLPKEDMYQLLAQAVDEITQTGIQKLRKN